MTIAKASQSSTKPTAITPTFSAVATETSARWPLYRFSVGKYQQLVQSGVFDEDDAFELLEGLVVPKMSKNPRHDSTIDRCDHWLSRIIPATWYVRIQNSLVTSDSVPEPDLAIVPGEPDSYLERHPHGSEVALVVEVADTSLANDRQKARLYARAGVENYWIVNLVDNQVEVFTGAMCAEGDYRSRRVCCDTDEVAVTLPTGENISLAAALLLPKRAAN